LKGQSGEMNRFADRLEEATYRSDESVSFGVSREAEEPKWLVDLPERIFGRLQLLASAYELHVLPAIDPYAKTRLNAEQCRSLRGGLVFMPSLWSDELVRRGTAALLEVLDRAVTNPFPTEVVIEGP